jgi:hypothetical protein
MIEMILDECLEAIRTGRATVAACLAKYPDFQDELGPLLALAMELGRAQEVKPSAAFRLKTRSRLLGLPAPQPSTGFGQRLKKLLVPRRA